MPVFHLDSFDSYAIAADLSQEYTDDNLDFSITAGRFGGGAFEITDSNRSFCQKTVPAANSPLTQFYTGFAVEVVNPINTDLAVLTVVSTAGDETTITLNSSSGVLKAWSGDQSSVYGTSTSFSVGINVWHWLEFFFVLSSSVGEAQIWADGNQLLSVSGVDTAGAGGTAITSISIGTPHNTGSCQAWYCQWYIIDPSSTPNNTRLGDSAIACDVPNSDASPNNGTPSTGTDHFACVDEAQWSSAKSLTLTNTAGQQETFGFPALGATPSNIWAVRILNIAEKTDAGTCTAESVVRSGSVTAVGASTALLTSYSHISGVFNVDPNTSAQWTIPGVNALDGAFDIT